MPTTKRYTRTRNLFDPASQRPFSLSRSRLENFLTCPRCFYLDRRLGVDHPGMPAFTLNMAVDTLLKKEFDRYRAQQRTHPLMQRAGIDAVPFAHPMMDEWRENFKGVRYHHKPTNLVIFGAIDDLWVDKNGVLFVVDYKATSTTEPITLETTYRQAYKRQMEIYQWLLKNSKFDVSDTGYFLYCNADKTNELFDGKLDFGIEIIPYTGNADWVEGAVRDAHACLMDSRVPDAAADCPYCNYRAAADTVEAQARKDQPGAQGELFS